MSSVAERRRRSSTSRNSPRVSSSWTGDNVGFVEWGSEQDPTVRNTTWEEDQSVVVRSVVQGVSDGDNTTNKDTMAYLPFFVSRFQNENSLSSMANPISQPQYVQNKNQTPTTKYNKHNHRGLHLDKSKLTESLETQLSDEVLERTGPQIPSLRQVLQEEEYQDPSLDFIDDSLSSSSESRIEYTNDTIAAQPDIDMQEEKKVDDIEPDPILLARKNDIGVMDRKAFGGILPPPPPPPPPRRARTTPTPEDQPLRPSTMNQQRMAKPTTRRHLTNAKTQNVSTSKSGTGVPKYLQHKNRLNPNAHINQHRFATTTDRFSHVQELQSTSMESLKDVGTDIQRLRMILKRQQYEKRRKSSHRMPEKEDSTYLAVNNDDPMQRAGFRLLSAAVIPIQSQVRRYLALKEALTRMWAVIILQAWIRKCRDRNNYLIQQDAAIHIQSVYRGASVREDVLIQHCCAMEIQRFVRGYLHAMKAYEKLYKITLVQSVVRRKLAIEHSTDRMVFIIQLQSIARKYLTRKRLEDENRAATVIQARWRTFWCNCLYELEILDIVIVQSACRRWKARQELASLKYERDDEAASVIQRVAKPYVLRSQFERKKASAITIQKTWRAFDCTMNYLNYVADVIVVQSVVRRWNVLRQVRMALEAIHNDSAVTIQKAFKAYLAWKECSNRSAVQIQSAWRGFAAYADYMFTLTDVVVAQSVARRWLMRSRLQSERTSRLEATLSKIKRSGIKQKKKQKYAAVAIQRCWRGFIRATEYYIVRTEHRASVTIQSSFRRFVLFSKYMIFLDGVIFLQSMYRMKRAKLEYDERRQAAVVIQRAARSTVAKTLVCTMRTAKMMVEDARRVSVKEAQAALAIQRIVRGRTARFVFRMYRSALRIQSFWRGRRTCTAFELYRNTRKLQSFWRGFKARSRFRKLLHAAMVFKGRHARTIQRVYRGHVVRSNGRSFTKWIEKAHIRNLAAEEIQRNWRGYVAKISFWRTLGSSLQIQKWYRGTIVRREYVEKLNAVICIQSMMRMFSAKIEAKQRFIIMLLVRSAVGNKKRCQERAASEARGERIRKEKAARTIQKFFLWVRKEVDREVRREARRSVRRQPNRQRKKQNANDERVLETVWSSAIESLSSNKPRRSSMKDIRRSTRSGDGSEKELGLSRDTLEGLDMNSRPKVPSAYSSSIRKSKYTDDDQMSMVSGISNASSWVQKPRGQMSREELDADFNLETAWIDAEIRNARDRRSQRKAKVTICRTPQIYS